MAGPRRACADTMQTCRSHDRTVVLQPTTMSFFRQ